MRLLFVEAFGFVDISRPSSVLVRLRHGLLRFGCLFCSAADGEMG